MHLILLDPWEAGFRIYSHFTGKETEAQREEASSPKSLGSKDRAMICTRVSEASGFSLHHILLLVLTVRQ